MKKRQNGSGAGLAVAAVVAAVGYLVLSPKAASAVQSATQIAKKAVDQVLMQGATLTQGAPSSTGAATVPQTVSSPQAVVNSQVISAGESSIQTRPIDLASDYTGGISSGWETVNPKTAIFVATENAPDDTAVQQAAARQAAIEAAAREVAAQQEVARQQEIAQQQAATARQAAIEAAAREVAAQQEVARQAAAQAAAARVSIDGIDSVNTSVYSADMMKGFIGALNTIGANIANYRDATGQFYSWAVGSIGANISYLLNGGATRDEIRAILIRAGLVPSALAIANNELTSRGLAPIAA